MPKIILYLKSNKGFRPQTIFSSVGSNIYKGIKLYTNNADKEVNYRSVDCMTVKWQTHTANAPRFQALSSVLPCRVGGAVGLTPGTVMAPGDRGHGPQQAPDDAGGKHRDLPGTAQPQKRGHSAEKATLHFISVFYGGPHTLPK